MKKNTKTKKTAVKAKTTKATAQKAKSVKVVKVTKTTKAIKAVKTDTTQVKLNPVVTKAISEVADKSGCGILPGLRTGHGSMPFKNASKLDFPITGLQSRCTKLKCYIPDEYMDVILSVMRMASEIENSILRILLALSGGPTEDSSVFYVDNAEFDANLEFEKLMRSKKIPKNEWDALRAEGKNLFNLFSGNKQVGKVDPATGAPVLDSKGKQIMLTETSNNFKSYFFSEKQLESKPSVICPLLRKHGIFPIPDSDLSGGVLLSSVGNVHRKISSYYEIHKERVKAILAAKDAKEKLVKIRPLLQSYARMIEDMRQYFINELNSEMGRGHLRNFIKRFRINEKKKGRPSIRAKMLEMLASGSTGFTNQFMGYGANFLNIVYNKYRNLWVDKDIISDKKHVSDIDRSVTWLKDYINISTTTASGKLSILNFGKNYLKYDMEVRNGVLYVSTSHIATDGKTISFYTAGGKNGRMCNRAMQELEIVRFTPDPECIYEIRFHQGNKNHKYIRAIKEPRLRWDARKKAFYLDVSGMQVLESRAGGKLDSNNIHRVISESLDKTKNVAFHFLSAYGTNVDKYNMAGKKLVSVAVDLGISPPWTASYCVSKVGEDGLAMPVTEIKTEVANQNADSDEQRKIISKLMTKISAVSYLIEATRRIKFGETDELSRLFGFIRKQDWTKILGLDLDETMKSIQQLPDENSDQNFAEMKSKLKDAFNPVIRWIIHTSNQVKNGAMSPVWPVPRLMAEIENEYSQIISGHMRMSHEDFEKYTSSHRHEDAASILKIKLTQKLISLKKKTMKQAQKNDHINRYDYINGKRRRFSLRVASDIINMCNKVSAENSGLPVVLFIENLSSGTSRSQSPEKNELQTLWGVGGLRKFIGLQAEKHGIAVVEVDPDMTSVTDPETKNIGYRDPMLGKENLYMPDGRVLNSDVCASKNILYRGLLRSSNINRFGVKKVDDNTYDLIVAEQEDVSDDTDSTADGSENESTVIKVENKIDSEESQKKSTGSGGKRRRGSLMRFFNDAAAIRFVKNESGVLTPRVLSKQETAAILAQAKVGKTNDDKKAYVVRDGDQWKMLHDLRDQLAKQFAPEKEQPTAD